MPRLCRSPDLTSRLCAVAAYSSGTTFGMERMLGLILLAGGLGVFALLAAYVLACDAI